jgi:hypothetical protein
MKTVGGTEQEMKIDKTYEVYQATIAASSLRCIGRDSGSQEIQLLSLIH